MVGDAVLPPGWAGWSLLKAGRYLETGSSREILPWSTRAMTPVADRGFVVEAVRTRVSGVKGFLAARSARPWASRKTTFPPWATSRAAPGTSSLATVCLSQSRRAVDLGSFCSAVVMSSPDRTGPWAQDGPAQDQGQTSTARTIRIGSMFGER